MNLSNTPITVYIGLGSNLDDPEQQIRQARIAIAGLRNVKEIAFSPLYRSQPVGPQDQPEYINAVMGIATHLSAQDLLSELQGIENAQGRTRSVRWGARTLDLDLLLYGQDLINEVNLQVPHCEMANRGFVLYPLADIAGEALSIPGKGSLNDLLATCAPLGLLRMPE